MTEYDTLPKSGYTTDAAKGFLLNAGALFTGLKWNSTSKKWDGELMGATSGGSSLSLVNTYRQAEIDGAFAPTVGSDSIESSEGTFEINFIEWTVSNLKRALIADVKASDGTDYPEGYQVLTPRRNISMSDYVENLAYVGSIAGSEKPIIIIMHNSICTSGLEVEPQDKQEGIYTLTFAARSDAEDVNNTSLPITILFPEMTASDASVQTLSADSKADGTSNTTEAATKGGTK